MTELRLATRRSDLALAQARWVGSRIADAHPDVRIRLVEVATSGDVDRTSPVASLSEVGAFVRAVQRAVLDGDADLAVHSCKDVPVSGPSGLQSFFPTREAPWDVLCGSTLEDLARGARVGTGSPRRTAQLAALRPDLEIVEVRGNVDTRLGKVASGEVDAVVLAEAGLRRIGREEAIGYRFSIEEMVPAPAQAALAVEAVDGSRTAAYASAIEDTATRTIVTAERAVLERTGAGCRAALGVFGEIGTSGITLTGFVADGNGVRRATVVGEGPDGAVARLVEGLEL